jgi:hypothetical protein
VGVASASLLPTLGVSPVLGRGFLPEEDASVSGQAARVALLSYDFWRARFGADPNVMGRNLRLDGRPFEVVGVLPPDFRFVSLISTEAKDIQGRQDVWVPLGNGPLRRDSSFLWDAAGILLLIGCMNVAILTMAESEGRVRELAVRSSLGAGRSRIVCQLLTESVTLGLVGTVVGGFVAFLGTRSLVAMAPPIPRLDQVGLNPWVLGVGVALGLGAGIVSGTLPGLLGRSLSGLVSVDPGFEPQGLATLLSPLLAGRTFTEEHTDLQAEAVVLVSDSAARRIWTGTSPLGASVRLMGMDARVIGVGGDVIKGSLGREPNPTFYLPLAKQPRDQFRLVARPEADPRSLVAGFLFCVEASDPLT